MNKIKMAVDYLKQHKDWLGTKVPLFLCFYFTLISLPYLFSRVPTMNRIFSNSWIAYGIRFGGLFIFILYALVLQISHSIRNKYWLILLLSILCILSFVSSLASPNIVISFSRQFTSKIFILETNVGLINRLLDLFRFFSSCLFFYFLYVVYSRVFKSLEQMLLVLLPSLIIVLIGLAYSFIFEYQTIIEMIKGNINQESIKSIFHSKNAYGIFLFQGSVVSTFMFFVSHNKIVRLSILFVPLFFAMSCLINCKMAAICIFVLLVLTIAYLVFFFYKRRVWVSFTILGMIILFSIFVVLFFSINSFHSSGILSRVYEAIIKEITNINIQSFIGRIEEWKMVPLMTSNIFMFIGFSRQVGYSVVNAFTAINSGYGLTDLHNAYVDFYAYHGIIGCVILLIIYGAIFYMLFKSFKYNREIVLLVFIIFFVSILFGMAETYTLFFSISANTFPLTFIIVVTTSLLFNNSKGVQL